MNSRFEKEVTIPVSQLKLKGMLTIPLQAHAIIIFSHGSGSSRFSKRNKQVADYLQEKEFGTLLFDLLTEEEDKEYNNRFNIDLLTTRLVAATRWLAEFPAAKDCTLGYFGASTGSASALKAAAQVLDIGAVVSRGGRPDLAKEALSLVKAPTLLIVGSLDHDVITLNRQALQAMTCQKELVIVEGASHLFEEPGRLDKVAKLAAGWFEKYLKPVTTENRNPVR